MARITARDPEHPPAPENFGPKVQAHQRYYLSDGRQVPGVTTIIGVLNKPALIAWANRLGLNGIDSSKYTDEAAAVGTLAHYMIECELRGEEPNLSDFSPAQVERASFSLDVFHQWREQHTLIPRLVEEPMVSERHGFGGTVDFFGDLDGEPTLLDIKTSSGIFDEHRIQVAAYTYLLRENGHKPKGAHILRIGRPEQQAGFEEATLSGPQALTGWRIFQHALRIYQLRKELSGRS